MLRSATTILLASLLKRRLFCSMDSSYIVTSLDGFGRKDSGMYSSGDSNFFSVQHATAYNAEYEGDESATSNR